MFLAAGLAMLPATARGQISAADVHFMQGMISHHGQALRMTSLVADRTSRKDIRLLAEKIDVSQRDEIAMMKRWLWERHESAPAEMAAHDLPLPAEHEMHMEMPALMPGMLTEPEMAQLAAAKTGEFDRLFLTFMIKHHEGAVSMVAHLFATAGAGQESEIFRFATDVDVDQHGEINRMQAMLKTVPHP